MSDGRPVAVVFLAGTLRPTSFQRAIGRSVLDLPLEENRTILDGWLDEIRALPEETLPAGAPVRILVDQRSPLPELAGRTGVTCERDPADYRGTAGVLRDLGGDFDPADRLLVVSAGQVLLEPLSGIVGDLLATDADVALLSHDDGTPGGIFTVRVGALASLPAVGYVDLKEQALPRLAATHRVRVVTRPTATGKPVAARADYVAALRAHHRRRAGLPPEDRPFEEDWAPAFRLEEAGAAVAPTAVLHDAVVLAGGRVDRGAVVLRSVVCPGGRVGRGRRAVKTLVGAAEPAGAGAGR